MSGDPFSHGSIVYTREQLVALCYTTVLPVDRPAIPTELRRRKRGCRARVKCREKKRRVKPPIPSVIMGNVRSLPNKMEELSALTRLQRRYRESSLVFLTETWLNDLTLDLHVTLDGFKLVRADRGAKESGKKKGGGLAMYVNNRWCNPHHISIKEHCCTPDIEILAVSIRPFYLPREFSHVIAITCTSPRRPMLPLLGSFYSILYHSCRHPTPKRSLISGDFNHAPLSSTLPTFTQYVNCNTRDNKTLDLFYANIKDAYKSIPLPPLGRSDHNLVHLTPGYIPLVNRQPPTKKYIRKWSDEASMALKDCFDSTDWEVLYSPHREDVDSMTTCVTDDINFCVDNTVPVKRVRCFPNNKPWVTPDLKNLLNLKKRLLHLGIKRS